MSFCENCGKQLGNYEKFCNDCRTVSAGELLNQAEELRNHRVQSNYKSAWEQWKQKREESKKADMEAFSRYEARSAKYLRIVAAAVCVIAAFMVISWLITFDNIRPDEHIRLSERWSGDSASVRLEGTYIYGAQTFAFKITATNNTRIVRGVSLQSRLNDAVSVILVEDLQSQGASNQERGDTIMTFSNSVKMDPVIFHRVKDNITFTSSRRTGRSR